MRRPPRYQPRCSDRLAARQICPTLETNCLNAFVADQAPTAQANSWSATGQPSAQTMPTGAIDEPGNNASSGLVLLIEDQTGKHAMLKTELDALRAGFAVDVGPAGRGRSRRKSATRLTHCLSGARNLQRRVRDQPGRAREMEAETV